MASATIIADRDFVIDRVSDRLFGSFIEHIGRAVYGGIYEPGHPTADHNGFRQDVLALIRELGVTVVRYPGGNFVSGYRWEDGIGPRYKRPARRELAWMSTESNQFGTDEFIDWCRLAKLEPMLAVNLGTRGPVEAGDLYEYCNHPGGTALSDLRVANGHRDPHHICLWCLGNEMDGPWQMGHRTADDYGKFALEAAKLMKLTDPNVKLIAAGSSNFGNGIDWTGWNRTVLEYLKNQADYLSIHMYVGNPQNDFGDFLASSMELSTRIKTVEGIIDTAMSNVRNRKIYIAWDEWNVWYRARGNEERGRRILEEHYNLEDALVVATFLNAFVNHAHIVKMANMAQLVNVIAPIFTNEKGLYLQTIYYPLQLFAMNARGKALELFVDSPKYKSRRFDDIPYLDISASFDKGTLVMNAVNRHPDQTLEVEFELEDKTFGGPVEAVEVNGPDIKSENTFDGSAVKPAMRSATAEGKKLRYSFAPHSYTQLVARLV